MSRQMQNSIVPVRWRSRGMNGGRKQVSLWQMPTAPNHHLLFQLLIISLFFKASSIAFTVILVYVDDVVLAAFASTTYPSMKKNKAHRACLSCDKGKASRKVTGTTIDPCEYHGPQRLFPHRMRLMEAPLVKSLSGVSSNFLLVIEV
ncbi:hypothetical protein K1719_027503 [Acacia pycnantha]|nr:hypothetical protein K1719_027503 [Acacia pycnantha]